MLTIAGVVTNHGSFTPADNPAMTFRSVDVDGLPVSLPSHIPFSSVPPVGSPVSFLCTHSKSNNGGHKLKAVQLVAG